MSHSAILFPLGVRLSTWLALLAFVAVAAWRSERAPIVAAIAWLAGFEAAYQLAAMLIHTPHPVPVVGPVSISLLVGMPTIAAAMTMLGARPHPLLLAGASLVFAAWIVAGFHVNTDIHSIDAAGEVFNETAKTLWAAAYLMPLLLYRRGLEKAGRGREDVAAAAAFNSRGRRDRRAAAGRENDAGRIA